MNQNELHLRAAEYMLGTLDMDDRNEFDAEMRQGPALFECVETWERDLAPLLTAVPEATPSPHVWPRIERQIAAAATATDSIRTVLKSNAAWTTFLPGIEKKLLHNAPKERVQSYLLRFEPGARLPSHNHKLTEECIVIEGSVSLAGQVLSAGDFQILPGGSHHAEMFSADGAVVYVRGEIDGPAWDFYRFARNLGAMLSR